jgi:hypothetical protein
MLLMIFLTTMLGCSMKKNVGEQLKLSFHPSFIPSLDFTLNIEKEKGEVIYKVYDHRIPPSDDTHWTNIIDTLSLTCNSKEYLKFVTIIKEIDFENYKRQEELIGLDGITTYVQYISNSSDTTKFDFWSLKRQDNQLEYKLLDAFFDFSEKTFKEKKQIDYLVALKEYYDYRALK